MNQDCNQKRKGIETNISSYKSNRSYIQTSVCKFCLLYSFGSVLILDNLGVISTVYLKQNKMLREVVLAP
jgi:hypothetical protein